AVAAGLGRSDRGATTGTRGGVERTTPGRAFSVRIRPDAEAGGAARPFRPPRDGATPRSTRPGVGSRFLWIRRPTAPDPGMADVGRQHAGGMDPRRAPISSSLRGHTLEDSKA